MRIAHCWEIDVTPSVAALLLWEFLHLALGRLVAGDALQFVCGENDAHGILQKENRP